MSESRKPALPRHFPRNSTSKTALHGVKVVDFSIVMAGPFATQILGDLGAEIIKIERPITGDDVRNIGPFVDDGERMSTFFASCNRNKKSVVIDLASPAGREAVIAIMEDADVLVENFTTRVMQQYGLDYATLSERFPRLIYLSVSGYGRSGSMRNAGGLDPVVSAQCGVAAMNGDPDTRPNVSTIPWVDMTTALNSVIGVLAALRARDEYGLGQHVDIAMYDTGLADLSYIGARYLGTGEGPERFGRFRPETVPSGEYICKDGRQMYIYTFNDKQYRTMMEEVFERPDLARSDKFATRKARYEHSGELIQIMEDLCASEDSDYWEPRLAALGVPTGVLRSPAEAFASPLTRERNMCVSVHHPEIGDVFNIGSPFQRLSLTPAIDPTAAPMLGEHTDAVLRKAGYDGEQINRLEEQGVISRLDRDVAAMQR